ncbi:MAG TPA: hypothetical protein VGB63_01835 [Pedobacter sp.]|jgi:hypothetical protein
MKKSVILLLSVLIFTSCEKELGEEPKLEDGTYAGKFILKNIDPAANTVDIVVTTSITINGDNYSSTSGPNKTPAGGSGKFSVKYPIVNFADKNVWTADFDWNLILSGVYTYKISGDSLFLSKKAGYNTYSYRLGRAK